MSTESAPDLELPFDVDQFLIENGIQSLSQREVTDHEGKLMPLAQAMVECGGARKSIQAAVEMAKNFGGGDVLGPMTSYLDKLSADAQSGGAKKKET
jgi:hypothetical protein